MVIVVVVVVVGSGRFPGLPSLAVRLKLFIGISKNSRDLSP